MKIETSARDAIQLHEAIRLGSDSEILHFLTGNVLNLDELVDGVTALSLAVVTENERAMKLLVKAGANVNLSSRAEDYMNGMTRQEPPLVTAARMGSTHLVEVLLNNRADPNGRASDTGDTALIWAARGGNLCMVESLLAKGASVNLTDKLSQSPVYITACNGYWKIAKCLIANGANLNNQDLNNESALMNAIISGQGNMSKLLIRIGADVHSTDADTNDPLAWAILTGNLGICKMLVIAGASVTPRHLVTVKESDICDKSLLNWLIAYRSNPPSLIHSCRLAIRKHLMLMANNKEIEGDIEGLGLPKRLKNFLALKTY